MVMNINNSGKIIINTGWLFGDKILRMGIGLLVGVWVARYLGPKQFGLLNYAVAFVALFTSVASLGLNSIVVRDLVQDPSTAETTMGTAFVLSVLGGLSAFGLALLTFISIVLYVNIANFFTHMYPPQTVLVIYIIGASIILNGLSGTFTAIFQALQKMEYRQKSSNANLE